MPARPTTRSWACVDEAAQIQPPYRTAPILPLRDTGEMVRLGAVVLHVKDAGRASQFWSQALGYAYRDGSYNADTTPVLVPRHGAAPALALDENDRAHLDLYTGSALEQQAEVERLISLGASRADWTYPADARFVVLADPEGNLFCVVNTGRA